MVSGKNWKLTGRCQHDGVDKKWMDEQPRRQIVASYLVNDLGQNWLAGARFFEHHLIDYDACCSNYGNWAYLGGVGNDPRPKRAFNVSKQAEIYDTKKCFQRPLAAG